MHPPGVAVGVLAGVLATDHDVRPQLTTCFTAFFSP
jgi:hypothetical protein